jgi:hypothetical protein
MFITLLFCINTAVLVVVVVCFSRRVSIELAKNAEREEKEWDEKKNEGLDEDRW